MREFARVAFYAESRIAGVNAIAGLVPAAGTLFESAV
jgi:hypothetical protein